MKISIPRILNQRFRLLLAGATLLALTVAGLTGWSGGNEDPLQSRLQELEQKTEGLFTDRTDPNLPELKVIDHQSPDVLAWIQSMKLVKTEIEAKISGKSTEVQIDVARRYLNLLKFVNQNYFGSLHQKYRDQPIPPYFRPNNYDQQLNLVIPVDVGDRIMLHLSTADLRLNFWHRESTQESGISDQVEMGLTPLDQVLLENSALHSLKQINQYDQELVRSLYSKLVILGALSEQVHKLATLSSLVNGSSPGMPEDCGQNTISLRATPGSHFSSLLEFLSAQETYSNLMGIPDPKTILSSILAPARNHPISTGTDAAELTRQLFNQSFIFLTFLNDPVKKLELEEFFKTRIPANFPAGRRKFWDDSVKVRNLFQISHYPSDHWDAPRTAKRIVENVYLHEVDLLAALIIENGNQQKSIVPEMDENNTLWGNERTRFVKTAIGLSKGRLNPRKSEWMDKVLPDIEAALKVAIPIAKKDRMDPRLREMHARIKPSVETAAKSKATLANLYGLYLKNEPSWTDNKTLLPVDYSGFGTGSTVSQVISDQLANKGFLSRIFDLTGWFKRNILDEPLRKAVYDLRNDQLSMIPTKIGSTTPVHPAQLMLLYEKKLYAFASSPVPGKLRDLALNILQDKNARVLLDQFFVEISQKFSALHQEGENAENLATDLPEVIKEVLRTHFANPAWGSLPASPLNDKFSADQSRCHVMESMALLGLSDWISENTRALNTCGFSGEVNQNEPYAIWKVESFTGRLNYLKSIHPDDPGTVASRLGQTFLDQKILNEIIVKTTLETESILKLANELRFDRFGNNVSKTLLDRLISNAFDKGELDETLSMNEISLASTYAVDQLPARLEQGCKASLLPSKHFLEPFPQREIALGKSWADSWSLTPGQEAFQELFRLSTSVRNKLIAMDGEGPQDFPEWKGGFHQAEEQLEKSTRTAKEKVREDYLEPRIHQSLYLVAILATIDFAPLASSVIKAGRFWATTSAAIQYALPTMGRKGLFNWIRAKGFTKYYMIYLDGIFLGDFINLQLISRSDLPAKFHEAALRYHLGAGTEAKTLLELSDKLKEARLNAWISTAMNTPVFYSVYHRLKTVFTHAAADAFKTLIQHGGEPAMQAAEGLVHRDLKSPIKNAAEKGVAGLKGPPVTVFAEPVTEQSIVDLTALATANSFKWYELNQMISQALPMLKTEEMRITREIEELLKYAESLGNDVAPPLAAPRGLRTDLKVNELLNDEQYKAILSRIEMKDPQSWEWAFNINLGAFKRHNGPMGTPMQEKIFALVVVKAEYLRLLQMRQQYLSILDQNFIGFAADKTRSGRILGRDVLDQLQRHSEWGTEFFQGHFRENPAHASLFFDAFQSGYSDALRRISYPSTLSKRLPFSTYKAINEVGEAYRLLSKELESQKSRTMQPLPGSGPVKKERIVIEFGEDGEMIITN